MILLKKLKRFKVKDLFVCKIFAADNLRFVPNYEGFSDDYSSLWIPRFLGLKILYGDGETLKDPIYNTKYVAKVSSLYPNKNLYYNKIGNITDIFDLTIIGKKTKISLTKIERLNSVLKEASK